MRINELFSPNKAKHVNFYSRSHAVAELDDGRELAFNFSFQDGGYVGIEFSIDNKFDMSGKGDVSIVFATVIEAVKDFLFREPKVKTIVFTAEEQSRAKMYDTLSKRVAKQLGWHVVPYQEVMSNPKYEKATELGGFVFVLEKGAAPEHRVDTQKPQHSEFAPVYYVYTVEFPELPAYKIIAKTARTAENWVMANIPEYKDVDLMGVFATRALPKNRQIIDKGTI
jgi:hypothetical protein